MSVLSIRGAREHNLQGVDLDLPHGQLIALCGVSGSGKSSLAFDTLYIESRRRYSETLSGRPGTAAEVAARPEVDSVSGLPPALALRQSPDRAPGPGATVGSLSGLGELLALLFARLGTQRCPTCDAAMPWADADTITRALLALPEGARVDVLAPLCRARVGDPRPLLEELLGAGFARVRCNGQLQRIEDLEPPHPRSAWDLDLVVDRLRIGPEREDRLGEAVRLALRAGDGRMLALTDAGERGWSEEPWCAPCALRAPRPHPAALAPSGAGVCPRCRGRGTLSPEGASRLDTSPCPDCAASGLSAAARAVDWAGWRWGEAVHAPLAVALTRLEEREVPQPLRRVAEEARRRLDALARAGLGHLPLGRRGPALSNGELRRLRLAAVAAQELSGVLYILDEPCAGVHPTDQPAVLTLLRGLRDRGNTVLLVDHSPQAVLAAQLCVEFGPGAGEAGGRVTFVGPPEGLLASDTASGRWLSGRAQPAPPPRRQPRGFLTLHGATGHNLRLDRVEVPLGVLCVVTGPSGAGKTSLALETLEPALLRAQGEPTPGLPCEGLTLPRPVRLRRVDSGGASGGGRSVVATWAGLWDPLRELWAMTQEAKVRGFGAGHFSLSRGAGLCGACQGAGEVELAPELRGPCPSCGGRRFDAATLKVRIRGLNPADVLGLSVREARHSLAGDRRLDRGLRLLDEVGLGYLRLGQPTGTLSGGEAQRLRLARELARGGPEEVLYILEEPALGLHLQDVAELTALLHRLVEGGATVLAVEHHPALVAAADWELRLGPGAGPEGGRLTYAGPPAAP